jgi:hypothetical protein
VTVDDDVAALRASMHRLPPSPHHRYVLVPSRSAADSATGAHWARFFADAASGGGRSVLRDDEEGVEVASSWSALAAHWGGDAAVAVAVVALRSRRGKSLALAKLAHRAAYLLLPDTLAPPPPDARAGRRPSAADVDNSSDPYNASWFWDLWLKVGVYDDAGRCRGGPTMAVLTNRPDCTLPDGSEAWHQARFESGECHSSTFASLEEEIKADAT